MLHARKDYQRIQDPDGKIPADEPVFLLRAQDATAVKVLEYWISLNSDDTAIHLAKEHVERMKAWPVKKRADVPPEVLSS